MEKKNDGVTEERRPNSREGNKNRNTFSLFFLLPLCQSQRKKRETNFWVSNQH